jgi:hypothetical protein
MALFTIDELNEMQADTHRLLGEHLEPAMPNKKSLDTILAYSRSLSVKDTRSLGKIFMNIN